MSKTLFLDPQISALHPLRIVFIIQVIVVISAIILNEISLIFSESLQAVAWLYFAFILYRVGNSPELVEHGNMTFTSLVLVFYGFLTMPGFIYNSKLPVTEEEIISTDVLSENFNKFILLMIIQTTLLVFVILSFSNWFNKLMRKVRVDTENHRYKNIRIFEYSAITLIIGMFFRILALNNILSAAEIINELGRLPSEEYGRLDTISFLIMISYYGLVSHYILLIVSFVFYYNKLNTDIAIEQSFPPNPVLFGDPSYTFNKQQEID